MAYRAEIQIGVVGISQLGTLQKSLNQVSKTVDLINAKEIEKGFNVQNLNKYNAQLQEAWENINKAAMGSKEELKAVQDLVSAKNNQIAAQERLNKLLAQAAAEQRKIVATENAGFGVQGPKAAGTKGGGVPRGRTSPIGGRVDLPGSPAALKAASEAQSKLLENLALGAGFPLLFGGGPGQVLGGLAGSFVGTGFGGQILGSAIGGQLEALGVAASEAGAALQKPIDNFGVIEQRALLASSSQERYVKNLIDAGQYIEATAAIQKRYNEVIGAQGSGALIELAKSSDRLNRAWSELNLQIQAALAGPLADLLNWIASLVQAGADANREARTQGEIFAGLSPEQQKEFKRREAEILKGANIFNEADKRRQVAEMARGFAGPQAEGTQPLGFRTTEVQNTASLERRREIQAQITQLRQAELTAAQAQVQQDITILSKQQEFALSLNQQFALIDKIATKKVEAANIEYQQVQRTQQSEIINKKLALESAQAKAVAARAEMMQLDAAKLLTPLKRAELQAVIDKVFVAEKDLAITKQVAHVTTQRAAADRESTKYLAEIESRQQKVAAYAADAARQTEAFNRAANEAVNAINNNLTVIQAYAQAQQTINNLEIQSLQTRLQQMTTTEGMYDILYRIRDLEIENARIALNATRAQIKAEVERQRIAMAMAQVKYKELQSVVAIARAEGVINQSHLDALAAQQSALKIATDNYNTSIKVANEQWRAADAVYEAAVQAANFKMSMEAAARSAQQTADAATTTAQQTAAAADFSMGATQTVRTKALPLTTKQLLAMKDKLGSTLGLRASYYGGDEETLAAMKARRQQQQEAMAQQMADNLQRLRSVPAERDTGSSGPINIQTGPVLQQDGKKYVTLDDMESAIQSMASTMYSSNRSAGTQRFTGVR